MNARAWEFVRAIRGPILLITFGTLTALNHTNGSILSGHGRF